MVQLIDLFDEEPLQIKDLNNLQQLSSDFFDHFGEGMYFSIVGNEVWFLMLQFDSPTRQNKIEGFIQGWLAYNNKKE